MARWKAPVVAQRMANWPDKPLIALAPMAQTHRRLQRIGCEQSPAVDKSPLWALICDLIQINVLTRRYWRCLQAQDKSPA